jgi:uncharacterized protein
MRIILSLVYQVAKIVRRSKMVTLLLTFVILILVVLGMSLGLILRGKPIKGTCASMASIGMGESCEICGGDRNKCEKENTDESPADKKSALSYNAAEK